MRNMRRIPTNSMCGFVLVLAWLCCVSGSESTFKEIDTFSGDTEFTTDSTTRRDLQTYRQSKAYRRGYQGGQEDSGYQDDHYHHHNDDHHDDHGDMDNDEQADMKAMAQGKVDYWGGYYDFLINEGSYKFWAVFQLATAALLIYSGFAALYYAKVNPPTSDDEFDDIFRRRRKRRSLQIPVKELPFCGLDSATFQRIVDAIAKEYH